MPSSNMIRQNLDLYPEQADHVDKLIEDSGVAKSRFFREAMIYVLEDPDIIETIINNCRTTNYRAVRRGRRDHG